MSKVFISHNNIISSLGFTTKDVVHKVSKEVSGLQLIDDPSLMRQKFYSSLVNKTVLEQKFKALNPDKAFTVLEQMMITSLHDTISKSGLDINERVGLIISTTKGNVDALDDNNSFSKERAYLSELGKVIASFFDFKNEPIIVSNACVSGVLALAVAKRYIAQGTYDHVFVVGGDLVTPFILSGFNSFQALSDTICQPYDIARKGINIGEVAVSALVTKSDTNVSEDAVEILGEGSCNDANHISGPSRTGEGLYRSMKSAFNQAKIEAKAIDYISAHGTATQYNDEMEATAFNRMQLQNAPLNSLKGYFGHTLGASGLLETIVGMNAMKHNELHTSLGFKSLGVTQPINVIEKPQKKELNIFLKTASGFGGCNTAIILKKFKQND